MVSTAYLRKISDEFGLWQHVIDGQISLKDGYSLDDNARALIVCHMLGDDELVQRYFNYLVKAYDQTTGNFIEFYDEHRKPISYYQGVSYDTQGIAKWALAYCVKNKISPEIASEFLRKTKNFDPTVNKHLRPLCYEILAYLEMSDVDAAGELVKGLTSRFDENHKWFEEVLRYANGLLVYVLARYYVDLNSSDEKLLNIITEAADTLDKSSRIGVIPAPHGNREWFKFGDLKRDVYGQQPVDAGFMVLSLAEVYKVTGDSNYAEKALEWMEWFTGNNIFKETLIENDSCADGIDQHGISKNRGAESTILYLWAAFEAEKIKL